jgi:hypothetical protein
MFTLSIVGSDGSDIRAIAELPTGGVLLDVSPDGTRAAYIANARPDVWLIDLPSGERAQIWSSRD